MNDQPEDERLADEQLALTIMRQILMLEARGVPLPEGWRKKPLTLSYMNNVLNAAIDWVEARE